MKKAIVLAVMFMVMGVATSPAKTILIDGAYLSADAGGVPVVNFYTTNFPGWTVTTFNGDDTANATVQATIAGADLLVMNRRTGSGGYAESDGNYYKDLTIPIIFHTSYVTRNSRLRYEGGEQAGAAVTGAETTVTAAGAKIFKVAAGTYDWHLNGFDAVGTGSVGTGEILATIGGNNLAVAWRKGTADALGRVQAGPRLLFNLDAWTAGSANPNLVRLPETQEGLDALLTAVKAAMNNFEDAGMEVLPDNGDGTFGELVTDQTANVTLHFLAPEDPNGILAVDPRVLGHYIYMTNGLANDPNLYLLDYVEQPNWTDPNIFYGPFSVKSQTEYSWQVENAKDNGTGNPFPAGDPNNNLGLIATFKTVAPIPSILSGPVHTLADAGGNAVLSVTTGNVATHYRWFKVGTPDTEVSEGVVVDRAATLTFTGATVADEGRYYCIVYNGDPDAGGKASDPSAAVWMWTPRLVNHYTMETMDYGTDPNGITPDAVSGFNMRMASNDTGADVPVLESNVVSGISGTQSLKFNNPRGTDPNSTDAQYAQISEGWAGGYKDITISAWVYSSGGSNWNRILDFGNNNANYTFLCINPGSVNRAARFAVNVNGTEQSVTSAAEALPDNSWTYVTATLSGNTGRIYINGTLAGTNTTLTNDPVSYGPSTQNWLGRSQWGSGDGYFNGMVDELKIYNYARTTEQIAQDYLDIQGEWVCNRELYNLPYDYNNDCLVNLADFAIFAATWLDSYRIYPD